MALLIISRSLLTLPRHKHSSIMSCNRQCRLARSNAVASCRFLPVYRAQLVIGSRAARSGQKFGDLVDLGYWPALHGVNDYRLHAGRLTSTPSAYRAVNDGKKSKATFPNRSRCDNKTLFGAFELPCWGHKVRAFRPDPKMRPSPRITCRSKQLLILAPAQSGVDRNQGFGPPKMPPRFA